MGSKEDRFKEVERLLEAKEFDQAILLVTQIVKEDPEEMERGQRILRQVNQIKTRFNSLLSQLDKVLYQQGDVEAGLVIIKELQEIYPFPNVEMQKTVTVAKKAAEFVANQKRFTKIMETAAGQIREGKQDLAVETYLSGFDLHKQDYLDAGYGTILEARVTENIDAISASARSYAAYRQGLQQLADQMKRVSQESQSDRLQAGIDGILALLRDSREAETTVNRSVTFLKERNRLIAETGAEKREDLYLSYLVKLTTGREDQQGKEGIAFVLTGAWDSVYRSFRKSVCDKADEVFSTAVKDFQEGTYGKTAAEMELAYSWSLAAVKAVSLDGINAIPGPGFSFQKDGWTALKQSVEEAFRYQTRAVETRGYADLAERTLRAREVNAGYRKDLAAVENARGDVQSMLVGLEERAAAWKETAASYRKRATRDLPMEEASRSADGLAARYGNLRTEAYGAYRSFVTARADEEFSRAVESFQAGSYERTAEEMENAYSWSLAAVKAVSLDGLDAPMGPGFSLPAETRVRLVRSASEAVRYQARAEETRGYVELARQTLRVRDLNARYVVDLPAAEDSRDELKSLLAGLDGQAAAWKATAAVYMKRSTRDIPMEDLSQSAGRMAIRYDDLRSQSYGAYRSFVTARADEEFSRAVKNFEAGTYGNTAAEMETAHAWSLAAVKAVSLDVPDASTGSAAPLSMEGRIRTARAAADAVHYQARAEETRGYTDLARQRLHARNLAFADGEDAAAMEEKRGQLKAFLPELEAQVSAWKAVGEDYRKRSTTDIPMDGESRSALEMSARFDALRIQGLRDDVSLAVAIAKRGMEGIAGSMASIWKRRDEGRDLMDGTVGGQSPSGQDIQKHPMSATEVFRSAIEDAESTAGRLAAYAARWRADLPHVTGSRLIQDLLAAADASAKEASSAVTQITALSRSAMEQHQKAQDYMRMGDKYMEEARVQLVKANTSKKEEDYSKARAILANATEQYGASINLEWDEAVSAIVVKNLPLIAKDITDGLNSIVQEKIAQLVIEAIKQYNIGEYNTALVRLQTAKNLRATLFPDPDAEIENWMDQVTNAIRATKGRELDENEANYAEVSQRLNLATAYYQNADASLKRGGKTEALAQIDLAVKELGYVTTLLPNNRIARVLRLRLSQLSDQDKFQKDRDKLVTDARRILRESRDVNELRETYLNLKDLDSFSPNYAGVPALIKEFEYTLGYATRPADPRVIAESRDLYQQAKRIYDQGKKEGYAEAEALLNRALALYRENEDARYLRAAIASKTGVGTVDVLPPTALAAIDRAKSKLSADQPYEADRIVQELILNYPNSKKYPPLLELQRKIQAAIQ